MINGKSGETQIMMVRKISAHDLRKPGEVLERRGFRVRTKKSFENISFFIY